MYLPAYGEAQLEDPALALAPGITVSVNSRGLSDVPVG